jgi:glycerophosphoryl diester phosphodiesterase
MKRLVVSLWILLLISGVALAQEKIVIGHRGAAGYLPEHTLAGYAYAHALGADYIEPDLVMTSDGILICLHDIYLEPTTDVEEAYPDRHRRDGHWYAADFTLAEVRELSVHERSRSDGEPVFPGRFPLEGSRFAVPTFVEMIELVQGLNRSTGRDVGLYPELKRPAWHASEGLPMEGALLEVLERHSYLGAESKIFVQCFEAEMLKLLRSEWGSTLKLVQLISATGAYARMWTQAGLDEIAAYANAIGPSKTIIETNPAFVTWAHACGLAVHPYTFRADDLPAKYPSLEEELGTFYFDYNVDGVFSDFPDIAARVLAEMVGADTE